MTEILVNSILVNIRITVSTNKSYKKYIYFAKQKRKSIYRVHSTPLFIETEIIYSKNPE